VIVKYADSSLLLSGWLEGEALLATGPRLWMFRWEKDA